MSSLILSDGQALRVREWHLEVYSVKDRREVSRFYMRELPFESVIITALGGFVTYEAISLQEAISKQNARLQRWLVIFAGLTALVALVNIILPFFPPWRCVNRTIP